MRQSFWTAICRTLRHPRATLRMLDRMHRRNEIVVELERELANPASSTSHVNRENALAGIFDGVVAGPGIWKWRHYLDAYDRHLSKFRGTQPRILEIGVYSGGSLRMWKEYFGLGTRIIGVDIAEECRAYADENVEIVIGDQSQPAFWQELRKRIPVVDVVIDDGSHIPEHQRTTMRELLPHVKAGGVYICEDIHGQGNDFAAFVHELADRLNAFQPAWQAEDRNRALTSSVNQFQARVNSIHLYPFMAAVELESVQVRELVAPRRGTEWQPYYPPGNLT